MRVYTWYHCHITVVYPYINTHSHIRKSISSKNIKSAYKMAIKASIKCVKLLPPNASPLCVPTGVHVKGIKIFW